MLQAKAKWNILEADGAKIDRLTRELNINPLLARLLVLRGIETKEQADIFLSGRIEHFYDPYLMDGMTEAVGRIRLALERREKIRIYGDYDADGVSSTSLLIHLFRSLGATFDYYIPHRVHEGYGLNRGALDKAKESGVALIVTVDTGISAVDEIAYATELGIDVVVTDHHEPPELLPQALAIVNPKKPGCPYPFKGLAGAGVAFKLAQALLGRVPEELSEIATIGTIADLMPLADENRLLVRLGLDNMQRSSYRGVRALLEMAGVDIAQVNAGNVAFAIAPRINASGRLEHADEAVKLLTTDDADEAEQIAMGLDILNKERQKIVEETTAEAMKLLQRDADGNPSQKVIVVAKEQWNVGVIGIVASKLLEKFYRPTIILSIDPETGMCKGSARSILGFDMHHGLTCCDDLLDHYGGHQAAAGMSFHRRHLDEFASRLNALAAEQLTDNDFVPTIAVDDTCPFGDVTTDTIRQIERLAPFGNGNPSPRFVFTKLQVKELRTIGKERQHLKLVLTDSAANGTSIEAVAFGRGASAGSFSATSSLDVLGELSINEWNGVRKPQIVIQDLCVPHVQVFDYRGSGRPVQKLETIHGHAEENIKKARGYDPAAFGLILSTSSEADEIRAFVDRTGCSVWAYDEERGASPLNEAAQRIDFQQVRDLVLYALPEGLEPFMSTLRVSGRVERLYAVYADALEPLPLPSRDAFKTVYGYITQQRSWGALDDEFARRVSRRANVPFVSVQFILKVFAELAFIRLNETGRMHECVPNPPKRDLTASRSYRAKQLKAEAEHELIYSTAEQLTNWIIDQMNDAIANDRRREDIV